MIFARGSTMLRFFILVLVIGWISPTRAQPLTWYVVPQTSPIAVHKAWSPVIERVSQATGLSFQLKVPKTIPEFEKFLFKGEPDIAFMNPYQYVVSRKKQGYIGLIHDSETMLEGILVVRKDSSTQSVEELNGKVLSFPAPNAFAASLYMRALLAGQKIEITPKYVKTHSNVYRSVLLNDVPAGGGINKTLKQEPADIQDQLRVLYTTPPTIPHPLAASQRLSEEIRTKISNALITLAADPANKVLFDTIQIPKPVPVDLKNDYQSLESLGLERYFVEGSE